MKTQINRKDGYFKSLTLELTFLECLALQNALSEVANNLEKSPVERSSAIRLLNPLKDDINKIRGGGV